MQRTLVAALFLSSALLLAGCEDEPEPKFEPTKSAATSDAPTEPTSVTTTEAGPEKPTLPDDATDQTKAGAKAFAEYYWEAINYAQETGDLELLRSASAQYCEGCSAGIDALDAIFEHGGTIDGGDYTVVSADVAKLDNRFANLEVTTRLTEQVVRGAGDLSGKYPAGEKRWVVSLTWQDPGWVVGVLSSS